MTRHLLGLTAIVAPCALPGTAHAAGHGPVVRAAGDLSDLQSGAVCLFDGAKTSFQLVESSRARHGVLRVSGIGSAADGLTFGAHLHMGPCVAGDGAAAGPRDHTDTLGGVVPDEICADTEMWLDLRVAGGAETSAASVPFVPVAVTRSVVVHAMATEHHTVTAGARPACLPVVW